MIDRGVDEGGKVDNTGVGSRIQKMALNVGLAGDKHIYQDSKDE